MKTGIFLAAAGVLATPNVVQAAPLESSSATISYHRVEVDGVGVFYREAGPSNAPTIVLLHGFPSSSREFDTLIPLLATRYHLIAPDFPGFGHSDAPPPVVYAYTFDHLAKTIDDLLGAISVKRYSLYLHDYGAPVGFRIMLAHPERLRALIIQNGNAYKEGLGAKWAKIAEYWTDPKAHPEVVDAFLSFEATKQRHIAGTAHPERYNPDTWTDEYAHLASRVSRRSRRRYSMTTVQMLPPIRSGRHGCASTSRRRWWHGGRMTRRLPRPAARRSGRTCQTPRFTCSTPAISRSTKRQTR
jgi:pimeloyl-ACP methyl ester carboxylesterase